MRCIFFGHRDVQETVRHKIKKTILMLLATKQISCFYVGNNGRFDYWVQMVLRELGREGIDVPYFIVLSHIDERALSQEQEHTLFPEELATSLARFAINRRNEWLIRHADMAVAYVMFEASNSQKLLQKAQRKGLSIINLAETIPTSGGGEDSFLD